jgi:hypothetical protein
VFHYSVERASAEPIAGFAISQCWLRSGATIRDSGHNLIEKQPLNGALYEAINTEVEHL